MDHSSPHPVAILAGSTAANDNLAASFVPSVDQALLGLLSAVASSNTARLEGAYDHICDDTHST